MSDAVYDAGRQLLLDQMHDALTAAIPGQMPDQLRTYWTTGEGGTVKIRWGTDGSFERCERLLRKYFPRNPGGLCAKLHKRATGEWPAEKGIQSHAGPVADEADLEELLDGMAVGEEVEIELAFDPSQPRAADGKWGAGGAKSKQQQDTEKKMSPAEKGKGLSAAEFVDMYVEQQRLKPGEEGSERYRKLRARWDSMIRKNPGVLIEMMSKTRKERAAGVAADKKAHPARKAAPAKKAAAPKAPAPKKAPPPGVDPRKQFADVGEDEDMSTDDTLAAHAGHHDDDEVESMDAALSDLDGPDEYAESMLPRYTKWQGMLAPIGKPTGDRRIFEGGALSNRDLPLPLLWQELSDDGHKRSSVVGTIDELDHREDGSYGVGRFLDPDLFPDAAKAMALLKARVNGPSVDLDDVTYAMKNADGTPFDMGAFEAETLAGGDPAKPLLSVSAGRISAATLVSIPAFAEVAHTWTLTDEIDEDAFSQHLADDMDDCEDCGTQLVAAGYVGPPLAAFMPRELAGPTAPTIADDGVTVYGHLATWGTCHVGFQNACVTPPHSPANYAYFHTGEVTTAEGERLPVGRLVLGAPHADLAKGFRAAAQHYDDTGRVTALIRAYEDEFGIAFAGVMVHDLDAEGRAQFAAMPLSGDWRRVGGNLELIGAISVPVPGFPVARSTGAQATALVAAGVLHSPDAQPVDESTPGTHTVTFTDVPPEIFRLLAGMGDADAVAAEVSGPDATADFAAQVQRELAAVGDTINRERTRLLDGLNPGE